ncbi:MAG: pyrroloquinoline quinone-dependent dehydrogenase [Gemmatimonadaceae bacterium]|jgi:quinoprotein glucose dehydrogenase|nr:pyrroloquinoline quinone-dependent dehydrogenase [Gemmatimonadaceae bacterium]
MRCRRLALLYAASLSTLSAQAPTPSAATGWSSYGGDPGGTRYSPLTQITRANVATLAPAWTARTRDLEHMKGDEGPSTGCATCHKGNVKFEATPVLVDGTLYLSTPLNRVVAIDPVTGAIRWRFDPRLALNIDRNEGFVSRGVALWADQSARATAPCARRVFFATVDARLFALDATDGRPCTTFGTAGVVRLDGNVGKVQVGQYGVTSPPVVLDDIVIVGSAIGDNRLVEMERGTVQAFDARTGAVRWRWDPIPRRAGDAGYDTWTADGARKTGAANAWAPLSVDSARHLVFIPTGSASPDFYGGERLGHNLFANSVVALDVRTGQRRWHFQVVHHDLWDYDVASQPTLFDLERNGARIPAVAVATKVGHIFVLHRETGAPLFPVEERAVPASTVPGEVAAATQPFPVLPAFRVHPARALTEADLWGPTPQDRDACVKQFASFRNEGLFTPPSLEGTLMYPFYGGGINWGGVSIDQERQLLIVNSMRLPAWVRLRKREMRDRFANMRGTPYVMDRAVWTSPIGAPCVKGPWGLLTAIDLRTGTTKWERPLGVEPRMARLPETKDWGTPNVGGALVTASGLVFIAAARDELLRAFDSETGALLWSAKLPGGGQATPMTYVRDGRQYIVIAAGGHGDYGTARSDQVVAFALPR